MAKASIERLRFCNFKLRTLLNVTQAINQNLPTDELLAKFKTLLSDELNIGRFILYSNLEQKWGIMFHYGIKESDYKKIDVEKDLLPLKTIEITIGKGQESFSVFDFVIPIFKNDTVIAYIVMGDIDDEKIGISPSVQHLQFIQTLTNIILVAIQNKDLVLKSVVQERMKKELEMAAQIQAMLVPSVDQIPKHKQIEIRPFYMSHYEVGGDLYDYGEISKSEVFFCIADVSGKGMSAAMIMSNFQANLRAQLRFKNISLSHIITNLNANVLKFSKGEHFVTMFLAKYNIFTQRLIYVNAGHLPPILFDYKTDELKYLKEGCPGIGMLDKIPRIKIGKIRLSNAKLLCFTDGLSEYSVNGREDYGLTIAKIAMKRKELDVSQTIDAIIEKLNVNKENDNIFDDITMLGVQFEGDNILKKKNRTS